MINLTDNTVGLWFLALPDCDWLASVFKDDDGVHLIYRFRYYVDDKSFDSADCKHWYAVNGKQDSPDELVDTVRTLMKTLSLFAVAEPYELMTEDFSDTDAFMAALQKAPFVSVQAETL